MSRALLGFSLVGLLIVIVIGFFIFRNNLKSASQENGTNQSSISKAHEAKAQADLKSVETSLMTYFTTQNTYPKTSSFSTMALKLENANIMGSEPQEPNQDFSYKYCSSNGTDFLLEAEYNNEIIIDIGDGTCQPGE